MLRPGVPFRPILPTVWARTGCAKDVRWDPSAFLLLVKSPSHTARKGAKEKRRTSGNLVAPQPARLNRRRRKLVPHAHHRARISPKRVPQRRFVEPETRRVELVLLVRPDERHRFGQGGAAGFQLGGGDGRVRGQGESVDDRFSEEKGLKGGEDQDPDALGGAARAGSPSQTEEFV